MRFSAVLFSCVKVKSNQFLEYFVFMNSIAARSPTSVNEKLNGSLFGECLTGDKDIGLKVKLRVP